MTGDLSVSVPQPNPSGGPVPVEDIYRCFDRGHDVGLRHEDGSLYSGTCHDCGTRYERGPVVSSARVDLDEIERRIARLDTDEYNQGVPKNAPWRAHASCSGRDRWVIYQPTGSDQSRVITEGLRQPFADFIAHAREDVPALVGALRSAYARIAELEAACRG